MSRPRAAACCIVLVSLAWGQAAPSPADDPPAAPDLATLLANAEGIDPEGRPKNYELADQARFYLWRDDDGWHLRTVGPAKQAHGFRGTVRLHGTKFLKLTPVGLDKRNDSADVNAAGTELTFKFTTSNKFDGVDINLAKADAAHIEFDLLLNGGKSPKRVFIGTAAANPTKHQFALKVPK
jgi:hypothetical protein